MEQAAVFNIQHFSLHDGPGVRTTCFLKGCNLRCRWCHNPESFEKSPCLYYEEKKCIGCGLCVAACPHGAQEMTANGRHVLHRDTCQCCFACVAACPTGALEQKGRPRADEDILKELLRDRELYRFSGGGVTFSGGEPLLQAGAVLRLALRLREQGVHIAVDTAANVPWDAFASALPAADLFLFDVKFITPEKHAMYTGVPNGRILENIRRAAAQKDCYIRVPVIAGVNSDTAEMERIARFTASLGAHVRKTELLTCHDLGAAKYRALNLPFHPFSALPPEEMEARRELFARCGVTAGIA